jgi:hypothetical protein
MPEQPSTEDHSEKKSRARSLGDWIQTTQGLVTLIASVVALIGGGAGAAVAITRPPGHPAQPGPTSTASINTAGPSDTSPGPAPSATGAFTQPATSTQLMNALLPTSALSSAANVRLSGTNLSDTAGDCGGALKGAEATAYEELQDAQTDLYLTETITYWDSSADAAAVISGTRSAIDQSGSCSYSANGVTQQFSGDYAGSAPQQCTGGQYLATQASIGADFLYGYQNSVQCGSFTIVVQEISGGITAVTQSAVDGYLSNATTTLQRSLTG